MVLLNISRYVIYMFTVTGQDSSIFSEKDRSYGTENDQIYHFPRLMSQKVSHIVYSSIWKISSGVFFFIHSVISLSTRAQTGWCSYVTVRINIGIQVQREWFNFGPRYVCRSRGKCPWKRNKIEYNVTVLFFMRRTCKIQKFTFWWKS